MTETITDLLADIEPVVRGWIAEQIGDNANSNIPGDQFEFEFTTPISDGAIIYYDATATEWKNTIGDNVYIGSGAGASITTAGRSVFIGDEAGALNEDAGGNVFVGADAGNANVSGTFLTFVGYQAGLINTDSGSTFVGYGAGSINTSGTDLVFVGYRAGGVNSSGDFNVSIGKRSGYHNATGSNNVDVGFEAGEGTVGNNKSGCVHIGYQAGAANNTSNRLYIDNSNTASPLIYGEFDNDILRFNAALVEILYAADAEAVFNIKSQSNDDADVVGSINFWGYSDGNNYRQYAGIDGVIFEKTDTSEEGRLDFSLISNGAVDTRLTFSYSAFTFQQTMNLTTSAGDLRIGANGTVIVTQQTQFDDFLIVDNTSTEALLVRKNADGGDVFVVDTTNVEAIVYGQLMIDGSTDTVQLRIQGHSAQAQNLITFEDSDANIYGVIDEVGRYFNNLNTSVTNFFAGDNAGNLTLTGTGLMCLGTDTGRLITTGSDNVFIGYQAGSSETDGDDNVYIGRFAGGVADGASDNVGIGRFVLGALTTGGSNTAIGKSAAFDLTTGSLNVIIGERAGENVTQGQRNVLIGHTVAGVLITGQYNVCIGRDAEVAAANTSYAIAIGAESVAGSNVCSIGSENATYAVRFGLNIVAPAAQMHIDQYSATANIPVLLLDQGDLSEQLILGSYSGADVDMIIIELDVDGAPKLGWAETPDIFTLNKGLAVGDGGATNYSKFSADGDLTFVGTAGLAYGSMYTNADIAVVATSGDWVEVDAAQAWTTGKVHNCSFADPEITVTNAGTYLIVYDMTILCSLNNKHIETGIMIDSNTTDGPAHGAAGVQDEGRTHAEFTGNTAELAVSGRATIQLAAGKTISLAVRNADAQDPTVTVGHGNLVVVQVAGGSA